MSTASHPGSPDTAPVRQEEPQPGIGSFLLQPRDPAELDQSDRAWRDMVPYLKEKGYQLRPRWQPDWVPSWQSTGDEPSPFIHEDYYGLRFGHIIDAVRLSDGEMVVLKRISSKSHPYEKEISLMFSAEPLRSNPSNHAVPILDVFDVPETPESYILVMPLLRTFYEPHFTTVGEAIEFCRQALEGLQLMHDHHVAHRDGSQLNIMMDPRPMYPEMFHPHEINKARDYRHRAKYTRRTQTPVKYYWIDFGLSRKFDADDTSPRAYPILGGDATAPEFQRSVEPCDPFPTDIYYLGNTIHMVLIEKHRGFEFLIPLINDMKHDDPSKRPTIHDAVARFDTICKKISWWRLRVPLDDYMLEKEESLFNRTMRVAYHIFITAGDMLHDAGVERLNFQDHRASMGLYVQDVKWNYVANFLLYAFSPPTKDLVLTDRHFLIGPAVYARPTCGSPVRLDIHDVLPTAYLFLRDIMDLNIMMDPRPIFPDMYHPLPVRLRQDFQGSPRHTRRLDNPVNYYITDFGLSRQYDAEDTAPLEHPIVGGDKTVPEFLAHPGVPCNPFPTDVYYAGSTIRKMFLEQFDGFEFIAPLINDMVNDDPAKRPTMKEVVSRFDDIRGRLHWWTLRARLAPKNEEIPLWILNSLLYLYIVTLDILYRRPSVPTPPPHPPHTFTV
ncbi:hypothetical protein EIP91_002773 [Steccherinum ochraceum]|uniref:Protein kinase domain-containing protein n=1 Tax=Steccherinum ochraceum TaxID=92696 RepID=A0A4R0RHU2_9APHY|nr:hypothetical protein EIP91_002773 [Steccherinum ochraceum]